MWKGFVRVTYRPVGQAASYTLFMIQVTQLADDDRADFVFEVIIDNQHKYKIWFSEDYYQKLTSGKISADELVRKSFEFLLDREPPTAILPEFELSVISKYFPEYERIVGHSS